MGILVDSLDQPAWIVEAIRRAITESVATPVVVIRNAGASGGDQSSSRIRAWVKNRRFLAYAAYSRIDRWKFPVSRDPFAPGSLEDLLRGVPVIDVVPRQTRFSDYLVDEDVERILSFDLDVAVRLGFRILRGRSLHIARYGVWSYHHGDNRRYRGGPAGFWEVIERSPVTGAILQVLNEVLDDGEVLARIWSKTDRFSVARNRAVYYWQAAPLLSRALRDLACTDEATRADFVETPRTPSAYSARLYVAPSNSEMLRAGLRLGADYVGAQLRAALTREQWIIGYRRDPAERVASEQPCLTAQTFTLLVPPVDRFWADPFPIRVGGRDFVFFEEFVARENKAHISVMEMGEKGPIGPPTRALSCDYHLSYPFVFEHDGSLYMIPETATCGRVELWRATAFPDQWEFDRVLLDAPLVDATLAQINGRWWMFAAGTEAGGDAWDDLYVYHAAHPTGPWIPHQKNPVLTDVRCARPAGKLFHRSGSWYRPAQDGSITYGGAIAIQEIVSLDETHFQERTVTRVEPLWRRDLVGVHTLNATAGLSVIDVRRRRWVGRP